METIQSAQPETIQDCERLIYYYVTAFDIMVVGDQCPRTLKRRCQHVNAKELTTIVNEHSDKLVGLRVDVNYLLDEVKKIRLLLEDLKTDVKMMEDSKK